VVTHDVPDYAIVTGNPAKISGWICKCSKKLQFIHGEAKCCRKLYSLKNNNMIDVSNVD